MRKLRSSLRRNDQKRSEESIPESSQNQIESFIPITYKQFLNRLPTPKYPRNSVYLDEYVHLNNTATAVLNER